MKLDRSYATHSWVDWMAATLRRRGTAVHYVHEAGTGDYWVVIAGVEALGARLASSDASNRVREYAVGGGMVRVEAHEEGRVGVHAAVSNEKVCGRLLELVQRTLSKKAPSGTFHVLIRTQCGYSLASVGQVDAKLCRDNYPGPVLNKLDHVVGCLKSKDPCGRLVLLDGPPGTGKSYAIRGLSLEVEATFVLVAPSLVGSLSGPELVPVLLAEKKRGCPIVLVMEDADHALVTRDRGELVQLSELLNMGDGLLGDLMDLRIIATTNAGRTDLDRAITRPGRLCSHVEFGALDAAHARRLVARLTGEEDQRTVPHMTVADVYRMARGDGWSPDPGTGTGTYV